MAKLTYQRTIVGYHGCDAMLAGKVLAGKLQLKPSSNPYDWLGNGIYFWEHGPQRAYEWAVGQARLSGGKVLEPAVLGARIDLGVCLDLLDTANTRLLGRAYLEFRRLMARNHIPLPRNRDAPGTRRGDKVLRFRDCAVIDYTVSDFAEGGRGQVSDRPGRFPGGAGCFFWFEGRSQISHPDCSQRPGLHFWILQGGPVRVQELGWAFSSATITRGQFAIARDYPGSNERLKTDR